MENPAQGMKVNLGPSGVQLQLANASYGMQLVGYGRGETIANVASATPTADSNRVEFRRGALTEWYVNGPSGLEQGFTLTSRPAVNQKLPVRLLLSLSGDFEASELGDHHGLVLRTKSGDQKLRYTGLAARDAAGKVLTAELTVQGKQLRLNVDDAGAEYPIVIDPMVQVAELTASDGQQQTRFGYSVGISGNTVVVGTPLATVNGVLYSGAAYVFVKPANGWTNMTQTAKLTASDAGSVDQFGYGVAIFNDTIVVGAPGHTANQNGQQGAVYYFKKPSGGWVDMTETMELTPTDRHPGAQIGLSVGINGNTVIGGAPTDNVGNNNQQGSAFIFVVSNGSFQTYQLTASDGATGDYFGNAVSISGNVALVGSPGASGGTGSAYVYVASGGWSNMTQTAKLIASDGAANDYFGLSVSISATTAAVGAPQAHYANGGPGNGLAYVFVKPPAGWADMTQTAELSASDGTLFDYFGYSVSVTVGATAVSSNVLSSLNNVVLVGAPFAPYPGPGAAYGFIKPAGGWNNMTQNWKNTASDGAPLDYFGCWVSISGKSEAIGAEGKTT